MTRIATLHTHPNQVDVVIVRTPPNDDGKTMTGFEPATYSPASHGYLMAADMLESLRRWMSLKGIHVVDERRDPESGFNPGRRTHDCEAAGCKDKAVTFADWTSRYPEEAQQLRDGLDAIKARSRSLREGA